MLCWAQMSIPRVVKMGKNNSRKSVLGEQLHCPSLLGLSWPLVPNFSTLGHGGDVSESDSLDHPSLDSAHLRRGWRMCLWQAAPADAKGGDLECSLGNPALETCSSSSGSHKLPRPPCTQHFLNTNLHEDGFLGCIICLAPFLSADLPPRKSAFKTRSTLKRIQFIITSERKKKKKAQQSVHLTQRFPTHFIFVDHWSLAFEDQHLYKSLENVQRMSVPKQPFGCRTPYLWLEFQLHLQKGCPLAPDGGRIQREASSGRPLRRGGFLWQEDLSTRLWCPGAGGIRDSQGRRLLPSGGHSRSQRAAY